MSTWITWRLVSRLILAGLLAVATELAGVGLVGTATWLIVRAADRPPIAALAVAIVAVRALAIAKGGLRYAERLAGHDAVLHVLADLRARVFAAVAVKQAVGAGRPVRGADALSRAVSDVDGVQDALLRCVLPAGVAAVIGASAVGVTSAIEPAAGLVLLIGLVAGGVLLPLLGYVVSRSSASQLAGARADATAATVDVVHGAADLTAFGAMPEALAGAAAKATMVARLETRAGSVASLVGGVASVVPALMAIAIAATAAGQAGAVLALVALAVGEVVVPLAGAAVRHAELRSCLSRVAGMLGGGSMTVDSVHAGTLLEVPAVRVSGAVVRYREGAPAALDGVDLELRPGARVAIVGASGSGKSTLLAALAGQVPLESGTVTGVEPGWPAVGGVFADAHVFHASVRENLVLGRGWLTEDDARRALVAAGLADWVDRLDAVVGEDGAQLSGGQRQRLLLARALIEPPPVLLLDEPTEGLDPDTADAVLDAALEAAGARTVVMVTHRHAHLRRFDEVVHIVDGRRAPIGDIPEEVAAGDMRG